MRRLSFIAALGAALFVMFKADGVSAGSSGLVTFSDSCGRMAFAYGCSSGRFELLPVGHKVKRFENGSTTPSSVTYRLYKRRGMKLDPKLLEVVSKIDVDLSSSTAAKLADPNAEVTVDIKIIYEGSGGVAYVVFADGLRTDEACYNLDLRGIFDKTQEPAAVGDVSEVDRAFFNTLRYMCTAEAPAKRPPKKKPPVKKKTPRKKPKPKKPQKPSACVNITYNYGNVCVNCTDGTVSCDGCSAGRGSDPCVPCASKRCCYDGQGVCRMCLPEGEGFSCPPGLEEKECPSSPEETNLPRCSDVNCPEDRMCCRGDVCLCREEEDSCPTGYSREQCDLSDGEGDEVVPPEGDESGGISDGEFMAGPLHCEPSGVGRYLRILSGGTSADIRARALLALSGCMLADDRNSPVPNPAANALMAWIDPHWPAAYENEDVVRGNRRRVVTSAAGRNYPGLSMYLVLRSKIDDFSDKGDSPFRFNYELSRLLEDLPGGNVAKEISSSEKEVLKRVSQDVGGTGMQVVFLDDKGNVEKVVQNGVTLVGDEAAKALGAGGLVEEPLEESEATGELVDQTGYRVQESLTIESFIPALSNVLMGVIQSHDRWVDAVDKTVAVVVLAKVFEKNSLFPCSLGNRRGSDMTPYVHLPSGASVSDLLAAGSADVAGGECGFLKISFIKLLIDILSDEEFLKTRILGSLLSSWEEETALRTAAAFALGQVGAAKDDIPLRMRALATLAGRINSGRVRLAAYSSLLMLSAQQNGEPEDANNYYSELKMSVPFGNLFEYTHRWWNSGAYKTERFYDLIEFYNR